MLPYVQPAPPPFVSSLRSLASFAAHSYRRVGLGAAPAERPRPLSARRGSFGAPAPYHLRAFSGAEDTLATLRELTDIED